MGPAELRLFSEIEDDNVRRGVSGNHKDHNSIKLCTLSSSLHIKLETGKVIHES